MMKHFKMGLAMGRSQLIRLTAIGVLVFIWALRWQWSSLTADLSWMNNNGHGPNANLPLTHGISNGVDPITGKPRVQGLGQPLANDIDLSDPDAPFIGWPLKRACNEVEEWLEGVVFMCDNNFGGVGNVRNFILTCVRYAIDAGATGIVMPSIRKRKDDNIKIIFDPSDFRPFNYLFDEQNFRQAMAENCPQMTIFDTWSDVPNIRYLDNGSLPDIQKIDPRELDRPDTNRCDFAELDHQTDRFQVRFKEFVQNPQNGTLPSANNTRLFRGNDWPGVLWEWPVMRDGPELANTFGGLCKFNQTIMRLGKKALAKMQTFARQQATEDPGTSPQDPSVFLGVHLRSEADAEPFWPSYEEQEKAYLGKAEELGLKVGYVASGNLTEAHKFAAAAEEMVGMTMVSKNDLLDGDDLDELHSLSWDQQGLVDYIVLTGADYFTGNSRSSFSISVTKKRHLKLEGLYSRPYKVRPKGYGRSFIVGPMKEYYEHWLFIWDAMWP